MSVPDGPGIAAGSRAAVRALLAGSGFVAAEEEADELIACSGGDPGLLAALVDRRLTGEPLAWITGSTLFDGTRIRISAGVYVPRWQSEPLARRAARRLPPDGVAVDLCTGSGAVARVLMSRCPGARVMATDVDRVAVGCAAANGVEVYHGDLFRPLPQAILGSVDVVVAVVPYVPTPALEYLPRDTLTFESPASYDGGDQGTDTLRRVLHESPRFLRTGGALLLELGGRQVDELSSELVATGYIGCEVLVDEEGDVRGLEATFAGSG